jgi:hypothetical protein
MRRIGEALYGRLKNYEAAFQGEEGSDPLEAILARTVYQDVDDPPAAALGAYVLAQRSHLATLPLRGLLDGNIQWATK